MTEIVTQAGYGNAEAFELVQRGAKSLATAQLMPERFRGKLADCMIVLEMAQRLGASPLMVAQNLYLVHGTPAWSAQFVISCVNSCGRFSALRYEIKGSDPKALDYAIRAWAIEKGTDERLDGPWIDWGTVKGEGWDSKSGSKWKTIPDLMFRYRAAAWWGRLYAPELTMGLRTAEEESDIIDITPEAKGSDVMREINAQLEAPPAVEQVVEEPEDDNAAPDFALMIRAAKTLADCDTIGDMIEDSDDEKRLRELLNARRVEIEKG